MGGNPAAAQKTAEQIDLSAASPHGHRCQTSMFRVPSSSPPRYYLMGAWSLLVALVEEQMVVRAKSSIPEIPATDGLLDQR